jgi:cytochrome P450
MRMRTLGFAIDEVLDDIFEGLARTDGAFELVEALAEPLPTRVTARLLGLPEEAHLSLQHMTDDFFAFFGAGAASVEIVRSAHAAIESARELFADLVADKRRAPGDDVLSALVAAEDHAPTLSNDELLGVCVTLVAGAYGTTTHLIGSAVLAMLSDGAAWRALVRDPQLAPACVEEAFRFDGPALSVVRRACEDVMIGDVLVPKDARIYAMLHAANRDPEMFPSPDRFDPTRASNRHLGLGAGVHFCLGASLTRLETAKTLTKLANVCPDLALAGEPVRTGNLSMRGVASLRVRSHALAGSGAWSRVAASKMLDSADEARDHEGGCPRAHRV